jgi:hypothetical protein
VVQCDQYCLFVLEKRSDRILLRSFLKFSLEPDDGFVNLMFHVWKIKGHSCGAML